MLAEVFAGVIDATVAACQEIYESRLQGVVVFGSVARDRMRPDSDLDLLVVAEPLPRGRLARMDEFDDVDARVASALTKARRHGATTRLSPIVRTLEELGQGGFLIFDIACDGRVVFDPEGAVTNYLAQVRDRLERRGAKRQTASGDRYWVLEPDVRPGDVVVL
jgi:predicted nucleotidyltransferase